MKETFCLMIGAIGAGIASLFGGWDSALVTLIIFMGVDFATGLITGAMGKSKHSKSGKLSSKAGWYGLAKKCSILMLIIVAVRLDILMGTNYVRDAVCIGFCVNELLSIVENTSLMGIPYPPALKNAIEVLQKQTGRKDDKDD
ncbi:MAG TPA: holin [Ruminococcus sp.]|nr:holin [Ruminococcus sp.]